MRHLLIALSVGLLFASNAEARVHRIRHVAVAPAFSSKSYLVADIDGQILKDQDGGIVRPIASISKLMVAYLVSQQDMNEQLSVPEKRTVQSHIPYKVVSLSRRELLTFALVKSDNFAAQILCENLPNCVEQMNAKAQELGMNDTHYVEPTGLSKENVSTAHDLLKLIIAASIIEPITELSRMPNASIPIGTRIVKINNTNPLTATLNIMLSKTGFTNPAGGCLVMIVNSEIGKRVYILLGSRNTHTRIIDMEKLVNGTY